jgi:spore coat polysaccharide biosynthesis protein SpsF
VKVSPPRIVIIIQARMGSSRLPGKILLDIAGKPMLSHVVERGRRSKIAHEVVVASTEDPADDVVVRFCEERGYPFTRGDNEDVLSRYLKAAREYEAQIIVRITADCPLIDPEVIDRTLEAFLEEYPQAQFGTNRGKDRIMRTYPIGMDVEVMSMDALEMASREAHEAYQREHVTPFLYETEGRFEKTSIDAGGDYGAQRWAVDTVEDLKFVREVFSHFSNHGAFGFQDVVALLEEKPELLEINAQVRQKDMRDVG